MISNNVFIFLAFAFKPIGLGLVCLKITKIELAKIHHNLKIHVLIHTGALS
jgi:hypothetical protein